MEEMMDYIEETKKAMDWLGRKRDTIFLGQTVEYEGSPMFKSLSGVPKEKRIEMPVAEDMQMGISIGLSLEDYIPISIYPRIDFLLCAINQLVNHLDKIEEMSHGEFKPGVIIRTQIGNTKPLDPGPQHCSDYTTGIKKLCKNTMVFKIKKAENIVKNYENAYVNALLGISTIIIETPQGGKKPNKQ
jgi:pyruvate/2-oxoglutarate/acetoin dehydrogenase E1 component